MSHHRIIPGKSFFFHLICRIAKHDRYETFSMSHVNRDYARNFNLIFPVSTVRVYRHLVGWAEWKLDVKLIRNFRIFLEVNVYELEAIFNLIISSKWGECENVSIFCTVQISHLANVNWYWIEIEKSTIDSDDIVNTRQNWTWQNYWTWNFVRIRLIEL